MDLHPSADDVYSRVRKRMPQISLGTIYRNLNKLVEMGYKDAFVVKLNNK